MSTIALTGATGYVGGRLLPVLLHRGDDVRALARTPEKADLDARATVVKGDVLSGDGLAELVAGADVAYYLVHSMGRGNDDDFEANDRRGATNFARAARDAGVTRIVYLGGMEDGATGSAHLRSRHEVAAVLDEESGPDVTVVYARAAMILGAESASYQIMHALSAKLPLMITPRWVDTRTQPIAIDDVVHALDALGHMDAPPAEAQLGGANAISYRDMMQGVARLAGKRPPAILRAPVLTPRLSSYWVSLFAPVERGLVRPLIDGLSAEMLVSDPPPPGVNDTPMTFEEAVRAAMRENDH